MSILQGLARLWRVDDGLPKQTDLIVLVSFGASSAGLSKASQRALDRVLELKKKYPDARVVFGSFAFNPDPAIEVNEKMLAIPDAIYAGSVASTIEEAEKIKTNLLFLPFTLQPRSIVVVTDDWHSRSAKFVWEKVWGNKNPRPTITFSTFEWPEDPDNPMIFQRKEYVWASANIARHLFLLMPGGFKRMKRLKIRQPT